MSVSNILLSAWHILSFGGVQSCGWECGVVLVCLPMLLTVEKLTLVLKLLVCAF